MLLVVVLEVGCVRLVRLLEMVKMVKLLVLALALTEAVLAGLPPNLRHGCERGQRIVDGVEIVEKQAACTPDTLRLAGN